MITKKAETELYEPCASTRPAQRWPRQYASDMVIFKRPIAAIIDAGNDIIMISYTSKAKDMLNIMMELSVSDSKYKSRIEESAARILKLKYEMGILKL